MKERKLIKFALTGRKDPEQNRKRVGEQLVILSVLIFFIFLINFSVLVISDSRNGKDLSEGAKAVHQTEVTVQAKRGTIYDRNGEAIAEDSTTYSIYAVLDKSYTSAKGEKLFIQADQHDQVAQILAEKLGLEPDFVKEQLSRKGLYQVSFGNKGNNISYSTKTEIEEAMAAVGVKGMGFSTSPGRLYANGVFASHFIGFARLVDNKDNTQSLEGQTGLEKTLDRILSGTDGKLIYQKDVSGKIRPGTEEIARQPVDGKDVYTTLSAPLQSYLETTMDIFQEKGKGVLASATLVAADTGEILATTQRPTFDADTKEGVTEDMNWNSALYQMMYEPGSTMKVMTLASAIDNGTFDGNAVYNNAELTIVDTTFYDWEVNMELTKGRNLTFSQGFAYSSNVGMALLEKGMGDDVWRNYLTKFDFGLPTRFGLNGEAFGSISESNLVTNAMMAFGQGINVTQVQMLKAFSAVANEGQMLTPQFISAIYDPNTQTARKSQREVVGKPISADAAKQTLAHMVMVGTDPNVGTLYNKEAGQPLITVNGDPAAVKSGTAQIAKKEGGGYLETENGELNYIYSVVAMYPSDNPDFIMYVTLQQPEHWASIFWTDVVNPTLEEAVRMKDILHLTTPSPALAEVTEETDYKMPDLIGQAPGASASLLRQNLVHPIIIGSSNEILETSVKKGELVPANHQVLLWTGELTKIPDMYGWTEASVKQFAEWTKIKVTIKGSGSRVIEQSVESEHSADGIKKMTITLGE